MFKIIYNYNNNPTSYPPQFSYLDGPQRAIFALGTVDFDTHRVNAVSIPNITPVGAIKFYVEIDSLLPQGWAEDPKVNLGKDGCVIIKGCAD